MASNNETVADIIAEVRTINKCVDRIEAAHKRELAAKDDERLTIVAMYENVIAAKDAEIAKLRTLTTHTDNSKVIAELQRRLKVAEDALKPWSSLAEWLVENSTKLGISDMVSKLRERFEEAKNALSSPPRNCDRPECSTTKAAQEVWRKEDGGKTAYYEWLLATSKEGEVK